MNTETTLKRINCLAAAVRLRAGGFDETPQQKMQRQKLIAEVVATEEALERFAASEDWQDQRVVNETWDTLWKKVQRELVICKVKL